MVINPHAVYIEESGYTIKCERVGKTFTAYTINSQGKIIGTIESVPSMHEAIAVAKASIKDANKTTLN